MILTFALTLLSVAKSVWIWSVSRRQVQSLRPAWKRSTLMSQPKPDEECEGLCPELDGP